ncbi:hypothetical protein OA313_02705, partial [Candidatus Pelagibacter sp.]|nr:hypothetical protein [Candidatus Pelagibacter sp.]
MLPKEFLPYDVDNSQLYRIGPKGDGGYIIHKKTIFYSKEILTFGLFNDWNFEKFFLKLNKTCKVVAYDHTVNLDFFKKESKKYLKKLILLKSLRLKNIIKILQYYDYQSFFSYPNAHIEKRIGLGENSLDINKVFRMSSPNNCLLKIDIEGDEYEIISQISSHLEYINTLIIEFHDINKEQNMSRIINFINSTDKLKLIHIHGNNCTGIDHKKDPKTIELTFVNNDYIPIENYKTKKKYPLINLDFPNCRG